MPCVGVVADEAGSGTVLSNAYQHVVWVYRAINALAEQVSNIPFRFSGRSDSGDGVITSGPLVEFYGRPHGRIDRSGRSWSLSWLELWG